MAEASTATGGAAVAAVGGGAMGEDGEDANEEVDTQRSHEGSEAAAGGSFAAEVVDEVTRRRQNVATVLQPRPRSR